MRCERRSHSTRRSTAGPTPRELPAIPNWYRAPSFKQRNEAKPGLPDSGEVALAKGEGKFGDALRFTAKKSPVVFFRGSGNVPFASSNWNGTVSFWLNVDPEGKLEPGFCDPIQITDSAWNDAAFFVEFEKRPESIPFRLGVYADFAVWNPGNRKFEEIPAGEKPLVTVDKPPFRAGRWTHVVFTFEHFNTGRPDGVARLYLDGQPQGELRSRQQTFTWDLEKAVVGHGSRLHRAVRRIGHLQPAAERTGDPVYSHYGKGHLFLDTLTRHSRSGSESEE